MNFSIPTAAVLTLISSTAVNAESGTINIELVLSDGTTGHLQFVDLRQEESYADMDNPLSNCAPPLARRILAKSYIGSPHVGIAEVELDFNPERLHRPTLKLVSQEMTSLIVVNLRAGSTPEEISEWLPATEPRREGPDWVIETHWGFKPAPVPKFSGIPGTPAAFIDSLETQEKSQPSWLDPETGKISASEVAHVDVKTSIRFPATYLDPETFEPVPCPEVN
ncbi:MAG: hypothetical protein HWE35_10340 [Rhodobacteraceae bacterium]|nr:hypothetical protein [Paracoccaceae bacterium]